MRYNYLLEVQVLLKIEFYKSLTMKYHLGWGIFWGTHLTLWGTWFLYHFTLAPLVIWLDDCAIPHYCAMIWFWVLLLLLIYSSSLTRLHNLGQYRVNEEEGVKLRKIGNDLNSMVFDSEWFDTFFYKSLEDYRVLWRNCT